MMKYSIVAIIAMAWLSGSLSYPDGGQAGRKLQKDDETLVYDHPGDVLLLKEGDRHPKVDSWYFYTAHEFNGKDTKKGLPLGFIEHRGMHMSRTAKVDNRKCSKVEDGFVHLECGRERFDRQPFW